MRGNHSSSADARAPKGYGSWLLGNRSHCLVAALGDVSPKPGEIDFRTTTSIIPQRAWPQSNSVKTMHWRNEFNKCVLVCVCVCVREREREREGEREGEREKQKLGNFSFHFILTNNIQNAPTVGGYWKS